MHGCPNRCRHCWLGKATSKHMTEDDLRWAAAQFRSYVRKGEDRPFIHKLHVDSWFREPDYSDDYERLYDLEAEVSDGRPKRCELLSIWRLARDPRYAGWAKKVGPDTCQITFFGLEETNDWFHRRKGAFRDCVTATERLLDVGMKPRWQLFLTKKIIPDLGGLLELVDKMKLRERVAALGGEFVLFIHPPGLQGEGRKLAHLNATLEDTELIPEEIIESSRKHFKTDKLWTTEAEVVDRFMQAGDESAQIWSSLPGGLYFIITTDWKVYSNMGTLEPWWSLGNLKTESIQTIFENFENDGPLGYRVNCTVSKKELAQRFGDSTSQAVVNGVEDKWHAQYCEGAWRTVCHGQAQE